MTKTSQFNHPKAQRTDVYHKRRMFLQRMQHKLQAKERLYQDGQAHRFSVAHARWTNALEDESGNPTNYGYRW